LNKHQIKNNQTYQYNLKKRKDEKANRNLIDSTKAIIVTLQDGKEAVSEIQSDLENRVYHDQEGDKGSFSEVSTWTHKSPFDERKTSNQHLFKRHYIYRY
jgi:hypothetical protein